MTGQFPQYSDYEPHGARPQPAHPSLGLGVTPGERDRAERFLADAYADGRLNEFEFDHRMGQVLQAQTRQDLNQAFYGLVDVPSMSQALSHRPTPDLQTADPRTHDLQRRGGHSGTGTIAATLAHLSPFVSWIFGPLLVYLVTAPRSFAKRQAAKAFNFQVIASLFFVIGGIASGVTDGALSWLLGVGWVAWFVLTIIGGVKAAQGEDWQNPVRKVVRLELLKEK